MIRKIVGRRAVLEALRSPNGEVQRILMAKGGHGVILQELTAQAQSRNVPIDWQDRRRLDKLAGSVPHQGVIAILESREAADWGDLLTAASQHPRDALLVAADEIEDPRNLGAIIRCAEGAGAQGMVIPSNRSAELSPAAIKASGGAVEHLPVAKVVNLVRALNEAKQAGLWIAGLDAADGEDLWTADVARPLVLVVGSEAKGLRRLTREACDLHLRIPMRGKIQSLNAAVAAGIALYEIRRRQALAGTS